MAGGGALLLIAGAVRTVSAPDRYSESRGDAYDIAIEQASGRPRTAELEALPATAAVETATFVFGALTPVGDKERVDALVFAGTQAPIGTRLFDGRDVDPARPTDFVASQSLVTSTGAHLGDTFEVALLTQAQADESGFDVDDPKGPALTATLVGVVDGPGGLNDDYAVALFPRSFLDKGDIGVSASVGVASLTPGATPEDLRAQLDDLPDGDQFSLDDAPWISDEVRAAVNAQGQGLLILAAIVAVAAVVALGQLLSRQLRLADAERSALRSLGLGPRHVIGEPAVRAALAVVPGVVVAAALAYAASGVFPLDFVRKVEPYPGRRFDLFVLGLGPALLGIALVLWVLCTLIVEARSSAGQRAGTMAERLAESVPSGQVSTAIRFAFGPNADRRRSVTASLAGMTLMLCVLVGALTFGANLIRLVDEPAGYGANFLAIGEGATDVSDAVQGALAASPDVDAITLYGTTNVAVGTRSLGIVGMEPVKGDLVPRMLDGRLPQGADEVALGAIVTRELGVGVGDPLAVKGASGIRALRVTGVALVPPVGGVDGVGNGGLVTKAGFVAIDPSATPNTGAIRIAAGAGPGAAKRIGALLGARVGGIDPPPAIVNLDRVRTIPFLLAGAVAALAVLSLGHVMVVAARRRRRDIAILRSLGATPRWVTAVVHWQATLTAAAVLVVALPIGTALGRSIARSFVDRLGAATDSVVPVAWLAGTILILLVLANLVAAVPARRSARDAPARALTRE